MSFLSHIGLSVIDKVTGNALDKMGNAIKKGDVSGLVKQFRGILEGVDDKLDDISELFEDAIDDGKKSVQREVGRVKKKILRETKEEIEALHEEFGDTLTNALMEKLEPRIEAMVEEALAKRAGKGD